jgi:hypothetical protein
MKHRDPLDPRSFEERLQESRRERDAEARRAQRLSGMLVKKTNSTKPEEVASQVA